MEEIVKTEKRQTKSDKFALSLSESSPPSDHNLWKQTKRIQAFAKTESARTEQGDKRMKQRIRIRFRYQNNEKNAYKSIQKR